MSEKSNKSSQGSDEPNLELPSFGLGRGRKKKGAARAQPAAAQEQSTGPEPAGDTPAGAPEATPPTAATEPAVPTAVTETNEAPAPTQPGGAVTGDAAPPSGVIAPAPGNEGHRAPVPDPAAPAPTAAQREMSPTPPLTPPSGATPPSVAPTSGRTARAHKPRRPPAPGSAAARREAAARRQALEAQREAAQRETAQREAAQRAAAPRAAAAREATTSEPTATTPTPVSAPTPSPVPDDHHEHTAVLPGAALGGADSEPVAEQVPEEAGKAPKRRRGSRVMSSRDNVSRKTRMRGQTDEADGAVDTTAENLEIHPRQDTEAFGARLPRLPGYLAAVVTGILMGLLAVVLAWASAQGCEAVRGVGSCGGFGLFALIVILGIEVLLGAALLKAWNVVDPVSTSFLGVGLVAVIVMLFFLDSIESRWMLVVIPVLTALTYLGSWWVTETLIEGDEDVLEPADD